MSAETNIDAPMISLFRTTEQLLIRGAYVVVGKRRVQVIYKPERDQMIKVAMHRKDWDGYLLNGYFRPTTEQWK